MGKNSHTEGWARSAAHAAGTFFAGGCSWCPASRPCWCWACRSCYRPAGLDGHCVAPSGPGGPVSRAGGGRRLPARGRASGGFRPLPVAEHPGGETGHRRSGQGPAPPACTGGNSGGEKFSHGGVGAVWCPCRRNFLRRGVGAKNPARAAPRRACVRASRQIRPQTPKKSPHFSAFLSGLSPAPAQPYAPAPACMLHSLMIANRQTRGKSCGPVSPSLSLKLYLLTSQNAEGPHGPAACGSGSGAVGPAHGT